MQMLEIRIEWSGPLTVDDVINTLTDGGHKPEWDGNDYGLHRIYGRHILCGSGTLLYIGKATDQTFSKRLAQHETDWLQHEEVQAVHVGRVYDPKRHQVAENWRSDVDIAERVLIYKHSPNYNNTGIGTPPDLSPMRKIRLVHTGDRGSLDPEDIAPDDF